MTRPHYLNGRVLKRRPGGVRRYAEEVAGRLTDCEIVSPRSADRFWSARVWEQTDLYRQTAEGVLLSVAHGGPVRHRRHVLVVHDLIAITTPRSVSRLFAASQRLQLATLIERAAVIAPLSRQVADEVSARYHIDVGRVEVVAPGIADAFGPGDREAARAMLGLDPGRPVVAALLDPTPRKNSLTVARLLTSLAGERRDLQLVVAGTTEIAPAARGRAWAIPRPAGALDLGRADDEHLAAMYRAADVFVSLSSAEGFGLPVVEAAVSGAAVVSTPVPSLLEHAGDAVVLVDGPIQARKAILDLLDSPQRRVELAERAGQRLGDLRWAQTAATLDEVMSRVGES